MQQMKVGVRELKARLSAYLRHVRAGGTVVITERGKPIGRIVPESSSIKAQLEALSQAGLIAWSGKKLPPAKPIAQAQGTRTVADLLLENRQ